MKYKALQERHKREEIPVCNYIFKVIHYTYVVSCTEISKECFVFELSLSIAISPDEQHWSNL